MIAVATTALFSIIGLAVCLVLIDSMMRFYNAAKAIRRSAQADRMANVSEVVAKPSNGVITAVRVAPMAPAIAGRRGIQQRPATRVKAPAAWHAAA